MKAGKRVSELIGVWRRSWAGEGASVMLPNGLDCRPTGETNLWGQVCGRVFQGEFLPVTLLFSEGVDDEWMDITFSYLS